MTLMLAIGAMLALVAAGPDLSIVMLGDGDQRKEEKRYAKDVHKTLRGLALSKRIEWGKRTEDTLEAPGEVKADLVCGG